MIRIYKTMGKWEYAFANCMANCGPTLLFFPLSTINISVEVT